MEIPNSLFMGVGVFGPPPTLDRDTLILPEVMGRNNSMTTLPSQQSQAFDSVWNAAGREQSIYYKDDKWIGLNEIRSGCGTRE